MKTKYPFAPGVIDITEPTRPFSKIDIHDIYPWPFSWKAFAGIVLLILVLGVSAGYLVERFA